MLSVRRRRLARDAPSGPRYGGEDADHEKGRREHEGFGEPGDRSYAAQPANAAMISRPSRQTRRAANPILEGVMIAAHAIRCHTAYIYLRYEFGRSYRTLDRAIRE